MGGQDQAAVLTLFAQITCDRSAVLDHAAIHVDNVKGAVWALGEIDGAETLVGGGHEFLLVVSVGGDDGAIRFTKDVASDQVAGGFSDEGVAIEIRQESGHGCGR